MASRFIQLLKAGLSKTIIWHNVIKHFAIAKVEPSGKQTDGQIDSMTSQWKIVSNARWIRTQTLASWNVKHILLFSSSNLFKFSDYFRLFVSNEYDLLMFGSVFFLVSLFDVFLANLKSHVILCQLRT